MAKKPGRNDSCPCGSGRKYKRCCLASDEAASRARQQALFDSDALPGDTDFDEDDADAEELFDIVEDIPELDVRAITSVCYTRGFVDTLSDLGVGGNVRTTAWEATESGTG